MGGALGGGLGGALGGALGGSLGGSLEGSLGGALGGVLYLSAFSSLSKAQAVGLEVIVPGGEICQDLALCQKYPG